jgi:dihydropteroate synthase
MVLSLLPDLGKRTLVMGILNVTPDSFSDGGRFASIEAALAHARRLTDEGADILDIGGESTRPGATEVPTAEEIARVVPVIERLAAGDFPPISIDTYKAATAEAALRAGAAIVNDVWGLQREPDIASVAAAHGTAVIVMHNRAEIDPAIDIIEDMKAFFGRSLDIARKAGIPDDHIILDPGVGFGKTFEQHVAAIARVGELRVLGYPILMGTSRKSVIGRLTGDRLTPRDRLAGTIATNVAAILDGAAIIRVHDVAAHRDAALVADALRRARA